MSAPNRIVIRRCPCHNISAICFEGQGGRIDRITPMEYCDQWEMRVGWRLRAHEWRKVESLAREAAEALEKEAATKPIDLDKLIVNFPDLALRRTHGLLWLQRAIHDLACEKGWWDGYERDDQGELKLTTDQAISKIALIHAELSEAVEEARKSPNYSAIYYDASKPEGFAVELADALIRILDLCGALGINAEEVVRIKHEFNKTRPRRHGGKLA